MRIMLVSRTLFVGLQSLSFSFSHTYTRLRIWSRLSHWPLNTFLPRLTVYINFEDGILTLLRGTLMVPTRLHFVIFFIFFSFVLSLSLIHKVMPRHTTEIFCYAISRSISGSSDSIVKWLLCKILSSGLCVSGHLARSWSRFSPERRSRTNPIVHLGRYCPIIYPLST
jgi:hypothetical protein